VNRQAASAVPIGTAALLALCLVYLLFGLGGHDPWKSDDAFHFGIAYSILDGQGWLIPHLAGSARLDAPPLYYWVAAMLARATGWLLAAPDGVRLATGLFGAVYFLALAGAGRRLHGQHGAAAALLVGLGNLGLLVPLHETQPASALLAATAVGYWGIAILPEQPRRGGLMLGGGVGVAFLAAGLFGLELILPIALLLPLAPRWRSHTAAGGLATAALAAAPLIAAWPALLFWRSPRDLANWWSLETSRLQPPSDAALGDHMQLLAWFAWPALPLAAWAVWRYRRQLTDAAIALPLAGAALTLGIVVFTREAKPTDELALLAPLTLLAAAGAGQLRRGAANAFDWFGMMTFSLVGFILWLGAVAIAAGVPAQLQQHFARLEPGYQAPFAVAAWATAAVATLLWIWHIARAPHSPWRAVTHWAAGVTLMWVLVATLWFPWIDYGKTYRGLAETVRQDIPVGECVAGRNLSDAMRASLHYFAGIVTAPPSPGCRFLLEQGSGEANRPAPAGWQMLWEGSRPGDRNERLRLYRREPPG